MLVISADPAKCCVFLSPKLIRFSSAVCHPWSSLQCSSVPSLHTPSEILLMWGAWGRTCMLLPPAPGQQYKKKERSTSTLGSLQPLRYLGSLQPLRYTERKPRQRQWPHANAKTKGKRNWGGVEYSSTVYQNTPVSFKISWRRCKEA